MGSLPPEAEQSAPHQHNHYNNTPPLTRTSIQTAHTLIKPHIHLTPVLTCSTLDTLASTPQTPESLIGTPFELGKRGQRIARPRFRFFFKCENFQRIGAFKIRGATHALSRLSKEELGRGVVTHSSGNHAQALALAAHLFNTTAHVIMPTISTPSKIAATKGYGAKVYFSGSTVVERIAAMEKVRQETGAVYIPPYDHPDIICGQGTMALELEVQAGEMIREREMEKARRQEREAGLSGQNGEKGSENNKDEEQNEQQRMENGIKQDDLHLPHLDAVIAPLGGGGMLSGISTALHPTPTHVYGVEPSHQGADDARRGLASTPPKRIEHVKTLTIADGLRTPLGKLNWNIISNGDYVKGVYAVTDDQIRRTMKLVLERMKIFVEPSAVVGLAMALFDEEFRTMVEREGGERGWDVGIVFSGGNVSVEGIAGLFAKTETETETETEKKTEKQEGSMSEVHGNETENTKPVVVNEQERSIGKVGMDGERKAEDVAG